MIIKNHNIELNDTSASEMARFRQIMLTIWRQQIEDDKNSDEWDKILREQYATAKAIDKQYANSAVKPEEVIIKGKRYILNNENHYQFTNASALEEVVVTASLSALTYILLWIKKNIGQTKELNLNTFPKNALLDTLSGTYKGHFIKCNRFLFEAIVDLKNIQFEASFRPVKTVFLLDIFDKKKNLVFRFETNSYEGLEYLAKFIGYDIELFKRTITRQYKKMIKDAGNDKDKLDIIYEVIPDFILAELKTDQQMYADIWSLLDQNISDTLGRDENKGILNILKTLQKKDARKLYEKLYERPLWVMKIYQIFSGDDRKNFVALIMSLCKYNKKEPKKEQTIYLKDGYWLNDVQLKVNWNNYMLSIENSSTLLTNFGNLMVSSSPVTQFKTPIGFKTLYKGGKLNPMDLINVKSVIGMDKNQKIITEAASTQVALFIKYNVDELSKEVFWDVINVASTLAGGYGAIRVLALEGSGWLLKTAAIAELSKASLDLVMLNDNAKKALKEAGLGILVDNWTTISITSDLTFLSLNGLFALARYGKKGVKVLTETEQLNEATHLEKQTEKAIAEIEQRIDVDVSKMSNEEFDQFVKDNPVLLETRQKVERIAAHKKYNDKFEGKFHDHFDGELKLERASRRDGTQVLAGTGGHNHSVIGENVIIRRYLTQPVDDMPFDALISVRYGNGQWIEKTAKSTMFPKNWNITRVKEEISLIYEKMIKSGKELRYENDFFIENNSLGTFKIKIEFDKFGNITNSYPL